MCVCVCVRVCVCVCMCVCVYNYIYRPIYHLQSSYHIRPILCSFAVVAPVHADYITEIHSRTWISNADEQSANCINPTKVTQIL